MYHKPTPEVEAEAGVIAEVMARITGRAVFGVTLGVYD